jgi:WD40 repeat protein
MIGQSRSFLVCSIATLLVWTFSSSSHAGRPLHTEHPVIILKGHQGTVNVLAFSTSARQIASADDNGAVDVWDVRTSRLLRNLKTSSRVLTIAFSPDGQQLATSSADRKINIWQLQSSELLTSIDVPDGLVESIGYAPDGRLIAVGCKDGVIRVYSTDGQLLRAFGNIASGISIVDSPTGARVAAVDDQGLEMWDLKTGELVLTRKLNEIFSGPIKLPRIPIFGISLNADYIILVGPFEPNWTPLEAYNVTILDTKIGKVVADLGTLGWPHFSFSPEVKAIAISSMWGIDVIDIKTRRQLRRFNFHRPDVTSLIFSPDGKQIASGHDDGTVRIWNVQQSRQIKMRWPRHRALRRRSLVGYNYEIAGLVQAPTERIDPAGAISPRVLRKLVEFEPEGINHRRTDDELLQPMQKRDYIPREFWCCQILPRVRQSS